MANSKISALTAKTSFADTDEFVLVDNAGTPTTKKITGANLKASIPLITAPAAWTPTFTGFGTVSNVTAYSWRVGSVLHFEVRFTSGTATATEARVSLGFNGVDGSVTTASNYPTLQHVGDGVSDTGTSAFALLAEPSKTYLCFGIQDGTGGTRAGLSKRNGDVLSANGWVNTLRGSVRIQGW